MKKTLVVLLILAVAGGVFAQEFSWSGGVDINGKIDFDLQDGLLHKGLIGQDDGGTTGGHVDLKYTNGGLTLGMGFAAKWWDADDGDDINSASIGLNADYKGDNFGLHVEMDLFSYVWTDPNDPLYAPYIDDALILSNGPTKLYGYYTFMDGALRFDVAYKGGGNGNWAVSDLVLAEFTDLDNYEVPHNSLPVDIPVGSWNWDRLDGAAGFQVTYTGIEGLSAGVQFPFDFAEIEDATGNSSFAGMTLLQSLWGAKYVTDTLGISFMIGFNPKLTDDGWMDPDGVFVDIHFGGSYKLNDAMTVSGDVAMESKDDFFVAIGAQFDYKADPLNAGIKVLFHDITDKVPNATYLDPTAFDFLGRTLELVPYASYWFIEDVLKGAIELNLAFGMGDVKDWATMAISPSIQYNVDPNASIKIGYNAKFALGKEAENKPGSGRTNDKLLDNSMTLGFSWAF